MSDLENSLQEKLKAAGYSLTKPRRTVFAALQGQEPQTMRELIQAIPNIDRATIYRTVELFTQLGIVERLQFGWKYKLELSDEFSFHHHHMTCLNCHAMIAIEENQKLESLVQDIADKAGFRASAHQIEIRGYCEACARTI